MSDRAAGTEGRGLDRKKLSPVARWMLGVVLGYFFIKASILALTIIPFADISDEPAHFSYVLDVMDGKPFLVIGESEMRRSVTSMWLKGDWVSVYNINYIAQHPPLYYWVTAGFTRVAKWLTNGQVTDWKLARLVSVISGTLTLLLLCRFLLLATGDQRFAVFATALMSLVPMFAWQSAGVSNDMFVTMLSMLAAVFWIRYLQSGQYRQAILMAVFLAMAAFTKSTALVLLMLLVGSIFFYLREKSLPRRVARFAGIFGVSMLLPAIWMAWSYAQYGMLLPTWHSVVTPPQDAMSVTITVPGYLWNTNAAESIFYSFFGQFGWASSGQSIDRIFLSGSVQYMWLYFLSTMVILLLTFRCLMNWERQLSSLRIPWLSLLGGLMFLVFVLFPVQVKPHWSLTFPLYALIAGVLCFSLASVPILLKDVQTHHLYAGKIPFSWNDVSHRQRLVFLALAVVVCYTLIFLFNLKEMYLQLGRVVGINGRYWFPLAGLLMLGLVYPGYRLVRPSTKILATVVALWALNEIFAFAFYVFPELGYYE